MLDRLTQWARKAVEVETKESMRRPNIVYLLIKYLHQVYLGRELISTYFQGPTLLLNPRHTSRSLSASTFQLAVSSIEALSPILEFDVNGMSFGPRNYIQCDDDHSPNIRIDGPGQH